MRERQLRFGNINRIIILLYVPLSIALAVFYLFTGNLPCSVLALLTSALICLPIALKKLLHFRQSQLLYFCFLSFLLLYYSGGLVVQLSRHIPFYSELIFFACGFFFAMIGAILFCCLQKERPSGQNLLFRNLFSFSLALASNSLLEVLNILVRVYLLKLPLSVFGIAAELAACMLGAAIVCILALLKERHNIHPYPLYAIEDFTALNIPITVRFGEKPFSE